MAYERRASGTREWAAKSANCITGCEHDCRYCYARTNAIRFRGLTRADWPKMVVRQDELKYEFKKINGTIMFPTEHDITPNVLQPCLTYLKNMLQPGNKVLIVSKPHLSCIETICDECQEWRDQILFRFTIGADDDDVLTLWEPHAPCFNERFQALQVAWQARYATSVSTEPMLDSPHIFRLVKQLLPFITDALWIGKMNRIDERVVGIDRQILDQLRIGQSEERIWEIYRTLKDTPKIKWKDSIKQTVGLPPAEVGEDM